MADELTGGCLCGAVRYRVAPGGLRFAPYACHCTDCQTRTGSAFGLQLGVGQAELSVEGETIEGVHIQPSGAEARIVGCPKCLTRLYTTNSLRPGLANLRAGTLDDSQHLVPAFHLWVGSKQPWVVIPEGVPALAGNPKTIEEWLALFGGTWRP